MADFQKVYDEFHGKIRFYLGRLVGETEGDDLAQEVFVKVHGNLVLSAKLLETRQSRMPRRNVHSAPFGNGGVGQESRQSRRH